jgi:hypothetical protein
MKQLVLTIKKDANRQLLRDLCDILTDAELSKLASRYTDRLLFDEIGEPFITIRDSECLIEHTHKLWIDVNDVVAHTIDTDD